VCHSHRSRRAHCPRHTGQEGAFLRANNDGFQSNPHSSRELRPKRSPMEDSEGEKATWKSLEADQREEQERGGGGRGREVRAATATTPETSTSLWSSEAAASGGCYGGGHSRRRATAREEKRASVLGRPPAYSGRRHLRHALGRAGQEKQRGGRQQLDLHDPLAFNLGNRGSRAIWLSFGALSGQAHLGEREEQSGHGKASLFRIQEFRNR